MNLRLLWTSVAAFTLAVTLTGCKDIPGRPEGAAVRPDQVVDFGVLYGENCAACHGKNGHNGDAVSLANPVYVGFAGVSNIEKVTANGVPGTLMPAFAKSQGGMLTDQQIAILAQGAEAAWGKADFAGGQQVPAYASKASGDVPRGQQAYTTFCASCHGADGTGVKGGEMPTGSIVDPAYLALISDQGLRSIIVAGQPDDGMPDWRSDIKGAGARAMTDQEISDVVAWLASHRVDAPGQVYGHP